LAHDIHPHHRAAANWGESLRTDNVLCFCRFTQLGLLRLLTNQSAMGAEALTQASAWFVYDAFLKTARAKLIEEPRGIDPIFRRHTDRDEVSTKHWADGYLAAFSIVSKIPLVTFDRSLGSKVEGAVLLG